MQTARPEDKTVEKTQLEAAYMTHRDGGLIYTYDAAWTRVGSNILWHAKVLREGEYKGQPNGTINNAALLDAGEMVRSAVEIAIERLSQVAR
jgi:hypothetical protein